MAERKVDKFWKDGEIRSVFFVILKPVLVFWLTEISLVVNGQLVFNFKTKLTF